MSDIELNHPVNPAPADAPTWTTQELTEQFQVHGFQSGYVHVTRKSDDAIGLLQFNGSPRVYHSFQPA